MISFSSALTSGLIWRRRCVVERKWRRCSMQAGARADEEEEEAGRHIRGHVILGEAMSDEWGALCPVARDDECARVFRQGWIGPSKMQTDGVACRCSAAPVSPWVCRDSQRSPNIPLQIGRRAPCRQASLLPASSVPWCTFLPLPITATHHLCAYARCRLLSLARLDPTLAPRSCSWQPFRSLTAPPPRAI